ncbi:hypothetical protein HPP92_007546 [Vanilla planifolia]|uniref:Uncharacterized protein n=1 Tax=Vanilla planifolia TaxID=51239 RepID=A0A835RAP0_VANPL|nr:hypothetical protein HPP92_007546 [Vanilla planifolia]
MGEVVRYYCRQASMVVKCILLMYYKNTRGVTIGNRFDHFLLAAKALSRKKVHYGSYASTEQQEARNKNTNCSSDNNGSNKS